MPERRGYRAADRILRRQRRRDLLVTLGLAAALLVLLLAALVTLASLGGLVDGLLGILPSA